MPVGNPTWEAKGSLVAPGALSAAAHFVDREYGSHGYRIGIAMSSGAVVAFEVAHSDGSRFNIIADKWGNVRTVPQDVAAAERMFKDMHRNAVQS
jgi:hypothetical protein